MVFAVYSIYTEGVASLNNKKTANFAIFRCEMQVSNVFRWDVTFWSENERVFIEKVRIFGIFAKIVWHNSCECQVTISYCTLEENKIVKEKIRKKCADFRKKYFGWINTIISWKSPWKSFVKWIFAYTL